jgi:prepilin-type N-terminal cleavage/methylation domain-containing protein/prepilin-type processing-associated H-X9-DG protein
MSVRRAFTLIELLVVVAIISLLISILLPALQGAKRQSRTTVCLSNLRQISHGWHMYADENGDISVPGRYANAGGGAGNPANWYDVGNGKKTRPRWIATMGKYVGLFAFNVPDVNLDRQDYDGKVYRDPETPELIDERNHAYGYNHQFLGNARTRNGQFINYPVNRSRITNFAGTVMATDSLGTAAGFATFSRKGYSNDGTAFDEIANHGWTLDPPRLTTLSDRGSGDPGTTRTGPDARHAGRTNALFCDGHAETIRVEKLGYRLLPDGKFVDQEVVTDAPSNRMFSGTGKDDDPPPLP